MIAVEPVWLGLLVLLVGVFFAGCTALLERPRVWFPLAIGLAVTVAFVLASGRSPFGWQPRPVEHHEHACTQTIVQDQLGVWQVVCR